MSTKTLESLDLAIAQKRVSDYSDDVLRTPEDTDDRAESECRLERAIDAFRWIVRAEETIRQATYEGLIDVTPQLAQSIESLYREWLVACEATERLLARELERGCAAPNISEFRDVASEVREKINSTAWVRKSRKFRNESGEC
jgi:hypothetical protein